MPCRIKDVAHLLNIVDNLNKDCILDAYILVSFGIVSIYPSIDNVSNIAAITSFLNMRETKLASVECVIEGSKICSYHNNSVFAAVNLLQTNRIATGAPNSYSYADIAVVSIDNAVLDQKATCFNDLGYFGRYRDDCF